MKGEERKLDSALGSRFPSGSISSTTCIFFLHNMKTAGTTLRNYLANIYQPEERYMAASLADLFHFSRLTPEEAGQLKLVVGHFPFGSHRPLFTDFAYFTLLREPIDRVISFYYHRRRSPQEVDYRWINENNISLEEYVAAANSKETDNGQVRRISGQGMRPDFGSCSREMLAQAQSNIKRHFALVGLQERFKETLTRLQHTFGWPEAPYTNQNISPNRLAKEDLDPSTRHTIERFNQLDLELYEWVRERFEGGRGNYILHTFHPSASDGLSC